MQNFVPLGTGNSRLMKSNIPAGTTWEQAIAMLNSGTFPYDTGQLNAAGISVEGTPLNKQTLLQDSTAQQFGLTGDATVDQVLQILKNAAVVNSEGDALETILGSTLLSIPGAQIATGSYVGTGTYGSSNPNSITFDDPPIFVAIIGFFYNGVSDFRPGFGSDSDSSTAMNYLMYSDVLSTSYKTATGFGEVGYSAGSKSSDGKTYYWYGKNAFDQLNTNKAKYFYFAMF